MSKKRNDFGIYFLIGAGVLAVALLTGCSSGDNGNSRGNGDSAESPPEGQGENPPEGGPGSEPPPEPPPAR